MTRAEGMAFVARLAGFWPAHRITPDVQEHWAAALADYPLDIASKAGTLLVSKSKFFPSFAELVQEMCDLVTALPSAEAAWALVSTTQGEGTYPPLVKEALRACGGSWELTHTSDPDGVRRNFTAIYKGLKEVRDTFVRTQDLPAIAAGKALPALAAGATEKRCDSCRMPGGLHTTNCSKGRSGNEKPHAIAESMIRTARAIQNGAFEAKRCECGHLPLNHDHGKGACSVCDECRKFKEAG